MGDKEKAPGPLEHPHGKLQPSLKGVSKLSPGALNLSFHLDLKQLFEPLAPDEHCLVLPEQVEEFPPRLLHENGSPVPRLLGGRTQI